MRSRWTICGRQLCRQRTPFMLCSRICGRLQPSTGSGTHARTDESADAGAHLQTPRPSKRVRLCRRVHGIVERTLMTALEHYAQHRVRRGTVEEDDVRRANLHASGEYSYRHRNKCMHGTATSSGTTRKGTGISTAATGTSHTCIIISNSRMKSSICFGSIFSFSTLMATSC